MKLLRERIQAVNAAMAKHPEHKGEIYDLYQLMESEIASGESPDYEFEKFQQSVKDITDD